MFSSSITTTPTSCSSSSSASSPSFNDSPTSDLTYSDDYNEIEKDAIDKGTTLSFEIDLNDFIRFKIF